MYYVYILHSQKDGNRYTGYTNNLRSRIKAHQEGFVRSTKYRRPVTLIHYEAFLCEQDAKGRELYLKGGNGKQELRILLKRYFAHNKWKTDV